MGYGSSPVDGRETALRTRFPEFYRTHAARYAELSQGFWDNGYTNCSHPNFRGNRDLYQRLTQLVPAGCGLDAGCGAGDRDVFLLSQRISENLRACA